MTKASNECPECGRDMYELQRDMLAEHLFVRQLLDEKRDPDDSDVAIAGVAIRQADSFVETLIARHNEERKRGAPLYRPQPLKKV